MKMETLQQRRDELERKEQQLKESLLKFDKFLKVNVHCTYYTHTHMYIHVPTPSTNIHTSAICNPIATNLLFIHVHNYIKVSHSVCMYVQENDLKRARALKKTKAEQDLGRQKDREMARLTEEIDELSTVVARQKKMVAKYGVYQQFMEKVLELSEEVKYLTIYCAALIYTALMYTPL